VAKYRFVTVWRIEAAIDDVWDAIYQSDRWPAWWDSVKQVVELTPGDERGIGSVRRYTWRSRLPYLLIFELRVTRIERPQLLEGLSAGELVGRGTWNLSTNGPVTTIRNTWDVQTTKWWMNLLAPLARPIFAWNHAYSMRRGGEGLAQLLGARLVAITHS
jgi:hypothetical protein